MRPIRELPLPQGEGRGEGIEQQIFFSISPHPILLAEGEGTLQHSLLRAVMALMKYTPPIRRLEARDFKIPYRGP